MIYNAAFRVSGLRYLGAAFKPRSVEEVLVPHHYVFVDDELMENGGEAPPNFRPTDPSFPDFCVWKFQHLVIKGQVRSRQVAHKIFSIYKTYVVCDLRSGRFRNLRITDQRVKNRLTYVHLSSRSFEWNHQIGHSSTIK